MEFLLLSPVQRFDSTNTKHAYLREYGEQTRLQEKTIKFDQRAFAIKMVMNQASEPALHIGFKLGRQIFSQASR